MTKLSLPRMVQDIIIRPRLLQLATGFATKKLTVLTAPAGYGKTVLLVQLVGAISKPTVWYQLDSYDNDFSVFLKYLVTGIRKSYPDFGKTAFKLIQTGEVHTRQRLVIASIINELAVSTPNGLVIVFDDLHVITEPLIYEFLQELLAYLPDGIHLMFASRTALPFPVDRLKLTDDLLTIETDQLRFDPEEIALLFAQKEQFFPKETAEALAANLFGWPAALRLMKTTRLAETQTLSYEDHHAIYDYLATAIYTELPEPVQSFLVDTSILDGFTAEFCNSLLQRNDADQILQYLETRQLFLITLTGVVKSFRYHDLFRDFLQAKLGIEQKKLLLYKAAELTYQAGNPVQSCQYLLQAGVTDAHLPVLVEAGRQAFGRGQWQTVAHCLKGLSGEQIQANPWLSYYQAQVEIYHSRLDQAEHWIENATALFETNRDQIGLLEAKILQAKLLRCYGSYQQSLAILHQAATDMPPEQTRKRVALYIEMYVVSCLVGRLKEAAAILTQGLELITPLKDGYIEAHLFEGLGTVNYMLGNYPTAIQMYKRGAEAAPDRRLPSYYAQDNVGSIYEDWGELDQALEYSKRNVEIKEKLNLEEVLPPAYLHLAGVYVDRGEFDLAQNLYRTAIRMIKVNNNDRFGLSTIMVYLARCLSLQGKLTEALQLIEEALQVAKNQSGLAWAVCREIGGLVLLSAGKVEKAEEILLDAIADLRTMGFQKSICNCSALLATIYDTKNSPEQAQQYAAESLGIASRLNLVQLFITQYNLMQPVLRIGLEQGIEVTFIQQTLARLKDRSLSILSVLAVNPEPALRLRTIIPLAEIGTTGAQAILKQLCNDPDREIRTTVTNLARVGAAPADFFTARISDYTEPIMELMMLGTFRVTVKNREIDPKNWRTNKVKELLAYLIHRAEPVTASQILENLWPQFDREKATANFHTTLYQLRTTLRKFGDVDLVVYGGQHYFVKPGSFSTDRQRFEKLISANLTQELFLESISLLEHGLNLYRGDYLMELDYEWVIPVQEHLKRLYFESRIALARYYLEHHQFNRAIEHLQSVQTLNPLHEEIYCLLMAAHAGNGDRLSARVTYEKLKTTFHEELGLEPSPRTMELYSRLYQ